MRRRALISLALIVVAACSGDDAQPAATPPPAPTPTTASGPSERTLTTYIVAMNENRSLIDGTETVYWYEDLRGDGTILTAAARNDSESTIQKVTYWPLQRWVGDGWQTIGYIGDGKSELCASLDSCLGLPVLITLAPGDVEARSVSTAEPLPAGTYRIEGDFGYAGLVVGEHFELAE